MKIRVLMATLVTTLLMGVQGFANPCDMACVDPCSACNQYTRSGDLLSGLKKLVNGVRSNSCDPCDPVVACTPCDAAECNPCDTVCDTPRSGLGGRLRGLFASQSCSPCDPCGTDCTPCGAPCDPCGSDDGCGTRKCSLRGLFSGFRLNTRCAADCGPCDMAGDCGPCDNVCNPCDDVCGDSCCTRGSLLDLPRVSLSKLFGGFRSFGRCDDGGMCGPCDEVQPCAACR
jgi:hypothetical protein